MLCPTCRSSSTREVPHDTTANTNPVWNICHDCGTWFRRMPPTEATEGDKLEMRKPTKSDDAAAG